MQDGRWLDIRILPDEEINQIATSEMRIVVSIQYWKFTDPRLQMPITVLELSFMLGCENSFDSSRLSHTPGLLVLAGSFSFNRFNSW